MPAGKPRYDILAVGALVAIVLGIGVFGWMKIEPLGKVGSVYMAKQMCSCVFVTGRSANACRAEFSPDGNKFSIVIDRKKMPRMGIVKASLGGLFSRKARFEPGFGCTVVN